MRSRSDPNKISQHCRLTEGGLGGWNGTQSVRKVSCFPTGSVGSAKAFSFPFAAVLSNAFTFPIAPAGFVKVEIFRIFMSEIKIKLLWKHSFETKIFSRDVTARRVFEGRCSCWNHLGNDLELCASFAYPELWEKRKCNDLETFHKAAAAVQYTLSLIESRGWWSCGY